MKEFARMDAGKVCIAAYSHVSMCCMHTHERTDYLPRKVCYTEMLCVERLLRVQSSTGAVTHIRRYINTVGQHVFKPGCPLCISLLCCVMLLLPPLEASRLSHITALTYTRTCTCTCVALHFALPMCARLLVGSLDRRQSLPAYRVCSRLHVAVLRRRFGCETAQYDGIERRHGL